MIKKKMSALGFGKASPTAVPAGTWLAAVALNGHRAPEIT